MTPYWLVHGEKQLEFEVVRGDKEHIYAQFDVVNGPFNTADDARKEINQIFEDLQERDQDMDLYSNNDFGGW